MTRIAMNDLPQPDQHARELSQKLSDEIFRVIANAGGQIGFDEYMELALYMPGLGYYSAGAEKIGEAGDFITAPGVSALFSRCLARQVAEVTDQLSDKHILELGPGTGALAVAMMLELEHLGSLPDHYFMLETSADLRDRQQHRISQEVPHLYERFSWLDTLSDVSINGVIIGNEILDALPICCIQYEKGEFMELAVSTDKNRFSWCQRPLAVEKQALCDRRFAEAGTKPVERYRTEINFKLNAWINTISTALSQGLILLIDYGYPRQEYFHPQRTQGTLLCHYRHHVHTDPFLYPGLQDITASVDFTAVAEAAHDAGLEVQGYTTQAHFLINCGIAGLVEQMQSGSSIEQLEMAKQARLLTMPGEMGERFKVIALGKNLDSPQMGFRQFDQRHHL